MTSKTDNLAREIEALLELKGVLSPAFIRWQLEQALPLVKPGDELDFVRSVHRRWQSPETADSCVWNEWEAALQFSREAEKERDRLLGHSCPRTDWLDYKFDKNSRAKALEAALAFLSLLGHVVDARVSAESEREARRSRGGMKRINARRSELDRVRAFMRQAHEKAEKGSEAIRMAVASWAHANAFSDAYAQARRRGFRRYGTPHEQSDAEPSNVARRIASGVSEHFKLLQRLAAADDLPKDYLNYMMEALRSGAVLPPAVAA